MLLKDHWYVAAPSSQLKPNEPQAVQFGDLDLVVYRDGAGTAHALLDRCCHRGVKLSCGRITDGNIACGYHGWQYDGNGKLLHVPALSQEAETPNHSVPSYVTAEADHYVWVWIPGESEVPAYKPGMPVLADIGGMWMQKTAVWDCNIMDAAENQLDFAHTPFSHPGIYPGHKTDAGIMPPLRSLTGECRIQDSGVVAFAPPTKMASDPIPTWRELGTWARFELPFRNYVFLTREATLAIYNWVPLKGNKCRLEFMFAYIDKSDKTWIEPCNGEKSVRYFEEEIDLLNQDKRLLESGKQWVEQGRSDYEVSVETDFPQLQGRRLYKAAASGNFNAEALEGKRRVFTTRA